MTDRRGRSTSAVPCVAAMLMIWVMLAAVGTAMAGIASMAGAVPEGRASPRMNVVFILADDLGYGDLGCYGHPRIRTPHLDALAAAGTRFTQFYVTSPVCTPTRVSFMTGRHPQRFDIHHADLPERRPRYPLPLAAVTVSELFQQAGYHTAHFGKWHLGEPPETGFPREQGFDVFFGGYGGRPSSSWSRFARYDDPQFFRNEQRQAETYPGYATDIITDEALAYLEEVGGDDRPFYIHLWTHAPHEPLSPNVKQAADYADLSDTQPRQDVYYGAVTNLDHNVGRVLAKLDELGVADRTLVVFSSDNGPEVPNVTWSKYSAGSAGPLRGMKTQLWEGGIRVPLIVRLPGAVKAGAVSGQVASSLDYLPTVCALAGVALPDDLVRDEGVNLAPVLTGRAPSRARTLYWEFHHGQRGGAPSGWVAIREGDWKLHHYPRIGVRRLYDLKTDVGERRDRSADRPEIAERLERKLLRWYADLPKETAAGKRMPIPDTEAEANRIPVTRP